MSGWPWKSDSTFSHRGWHIYQGAADSTYLRRICKTQSPDPPQPRSERGGVGKAGVVIFPLTPGLLLAMFDGVNALPAPQSQLGPRDLGDLNREIAAASSTCGFERPGRNMGGPYPRAATWTKRCPKDSYSILLRTTR